MFEYTQSKEYLARLLANENINVVRSAEANTAWFDLKNRTMTLPIWDTSEEVYDLLTLHEISHALNTPLEGWHDAVSVDGLPKSYLNIIEDARIERLITTRYAGAARAMRDGYAKINEQDIFGIEKNNLVVNELPLIDRINLHYKLGDHLYVSFSEEERVWLDKIDKLETWEDVVALCKELYIVEKEKKSENPIQQNLDMDDVEEGFDDPENSDEANDPENSDTADGSENSDGADEANDPENPDEADGSESSDGADEANDQENSGQAKDDGAGNVDPIDSITDKEYRENFKKFEKDIIQKTFGNVASLSLGKQNCEKFLVPVNATREHIEEAGVPYMPNLVSALIEEQKSVVNNMVKEFESKKRASSNARQQYAKSGRLDVNKMYKYKFSEDIFRRNLVENKGKNHGLVMLFDWSGSMFDKLYDTFLQTVTLAMFCQKAKIPFSVQLFVRNSKDDSINWWDTKKVDTNGHFVKEKSLRLIEVLSSESNQSQFYRDLSNLNFLVSLVTNLSKYDPKFTKLPDSAAKEYLAAFNFDLNTNTLYSMFGLGSTPLNSALFLMDDYITKFKSRHNLEITNLIVMTDGESDTTIISRNMKFFAMDKVTGKIYKNQPSKQNPYGSYSYAPETNIMYDLLRTRHKNTLNVIGYFVSAKHKIKEILRNFDAENTNSLKDNSIIMVSRNNNMLADRFFLIPKNSLEIEEEWNLEKETPVNAIKNSFKKHMKSKKQSRVFVSKFIETISQKL